MIAQKQAIDALKSGVERSIVLVHQLLALARAESEVIEDHFISFAVMDAVKDSLSQFIQPASRKHIDLGVVQSVESHIWGNKDMIVIMINNVIDNAIRYTPEGGTIDIDVSAKNNEVVISVSDTGPGIIPEESEMVFDRFYRGANTAKSYGTGLGLSIVHEIAKKHCATISLGKSAYLGGLNVKIAFPEKKES